MYQPDLFGVVLKVSAQGHFHKKWEPAATAPNSHFLFLTDFHNRWTEKLAARPVRLGGFGSLIDVAE